jgi:hypothetical protein
MPLLVSTRAHAAILGARAYVYGYPVVVMEWSRVLANAADTERGFGAPTNTLRHLAQVPDHTFRAVVRPNQDTLYSVSFLDLSRGPLALHLPEVTERRFVSFTFLDAWTNAFATAGSRNTRAMEGGGNAARTYLVVGPDDAGTHGYADVVRAPTKMVWVIGRTELFGPSDLPRAREIQAGVSLRPLRLAGTSEPPAADPWPRKLEVGTDPQALVRAMPALDFFRELCRLLAEYPPDGDERILSALARVGIHPGTFEPEALPAHVRAGLEDGWRLGRRSIALARTAASARPGWGPPPWIPMGVYGRSYLVRALIAHLGLGANPREEAIYMNAARDGYGRYFDSSRHDYVLRFEPGGLPPVRSFWSVSLYGADGFFVANPAARHVLGSHDPLSLAPDGAVEILVQRERPNDPRNWLPAPAGRFELTLRMYWPERALLEGRWTPPRILVRPLSSRGG